MSQTKETTIPFINTIRNYKSSYLRADIFAGITVASILIPQAMAYAMLAGLPAIYGLYGGLIPLLLYAIFASSTKMSVGPVAISSLLILSGVSQLAEPGSQEYITLVLGAGLLIGILQALLGFFRLGFVVNFLSQPVIVGFTSAAAIIILVSQLKDALGIEMPSFDNILDICMYCFKHVANTNPISLGLTLATMAIIIGFKKMSRSIPGPLIAVILSIALSYFVGFESKGVAIVGSIPSGLPSFNPILLSFDQVKLLIPTILTVTLIGIVECIGIAKALEVKYRDHRVFPNSELKAIGFAKIGGAFFQAIPTSGSFTRSAINSEAGAKTTLASFITVLMIILTLLFLTGIFYFLPKPVLAGIILVSVFGLFNIKEAKHLWRIHKPDFIMMIITFICTLLLGIELGVLVGVLFSILAILYKISNPNIVTLGNIAGTPSYKDVTRFAEAKEREDMVVFRFENQIFFANTSVFKDKILEYIDLKPKLKYILLDAKLIYDLDSSGTNVLYEIDNFLKGRNIELHMCGAIGPVRDMLHKAGLLGELDRHHINVSDAVKRIDNPDRKEDRKFRATQKNIE